MLDRSFHTTTKVMEAVTDVFTRGVKCFQFLCCWRRTDLQASDPVTLTVFRCTLCYTCRCYARVFGMIVPQLPVLPYAVEQAAD